MKKHLIAIALAASVALPLAASAATADTGVGSGDPTQSTFRLVSCDGVQKFVKDANGQIVMKDGKPELDPTSVPCDFNQVVVTVNRILKFLFFISIPIITLMIAYTGWTYLTANGDAGKVSKAKGMVMPILIGLFWLGAGYFVIFQLLDYFVSAQFKTDAQSSLQFLKPTK